MTNPELDELSPLKRAIVEIRDLKARVAAAERREHEPIAVVGLGLRYPGGAHDAASFWELLCDGVDAIREVPADRWSNDEMYDADPDTPGTVSSRWGGFLDDLDRFDARFFGISPREAESLDPQQRLLLEVAWEALEDAQIPADSVFDSNTGVFLGISNSDYMRMLLADSDSIDTYTTTGNATSIAAGRLSYVLGARGPSIALDTACSSSLVAVHLAVRALRAGECDIALAGGVNVILTPEITISLSRAKTLAADGRCKAFDAAADGMVRSEGCALVTLKRLGDAVASGDRVLAVIRGSAVNQDGRSGGITAPNGPSQEDVVRAALADANAAPLDVAYVEAHGTGTLLGDPIEVGALGTVLCRDRPQHRPLLIGSVKTNIGHTESAAGIAGLIKAVLMLHHGEIPPHLHLRELNAHIAAGGHAIDVPCKRRPWPVPAGERVAGVSSFGLSGTNAHVVLGEAPVTAALAPETRGTRAALNVVTLSARSPEALADLAAATAESLRRQPDVALNDVARAANVGRTHHDLRRAVVARSVDELVAELDAPRGHGDPTPARATMAGVAFLFTGHGSQFADMGTTLYDTCPVFADAIDRCDALLRAHVDLPLLEILHGDDALLDSIEYGAPALFSLQYALTELWASWGVRPTIVAGHSAGEYVAAVVSGVLSLVDGLRIIAARGRLIETLRGEDGLMAAVFVDEATAAAAVARHATEVAIAAVNGPLTTVISGRRAAVAAVVAALGLDDDDVRLLHVPVAGHSPIFDPILQPFQAVVEQVALSRPQIGLVSSMTGSFVVDEIADTNYWRRHMREPVRFADVYDTLREAGCSTFIEIGPDTTLLNLGRRNWPDASGTWIASMRRDVADEELTMVTALAELHVAGVPVDWRAFADEPARRSSGTRVDLPTYPWQRESYWAPSSRRSRAPAAAPLWPAALRAAQQQSEQGPLDLDAASYPERWDILDRLAGGYIANALCDLGLFVTDGESHTASDLIGSGHFASAYEHLVVRWLDHLVADGVLTHDDGRYVAPVALAPAPVDAQLDVARTAFVGIEPLLDYVVRCGGHLAAVVNGQEMALDTLFPDGSYETVDFIYSTWAVTRYYNNIVRAAAAAASVSRHGRALRVLEIGAGTGGTTAAVLPVIDPNGGSYTFTDVSDFFLTRAAERFAAYPFIRYAQLDIEQPPAAQGFVPGSYDLVIAANVLHATRDLDVTLTHVHELLAPGATMIAFESTRHPRWFDITTALIEGWQRFEDEWRTDVPLIDTDRWRAALARADFVEVHPFPGGDTATPAFLQHVILARASGEEASAPAAFDRSEHGDVEGSTAAADAEVFVDVHELLAEAMDDERIEILVGAVRRGIGRVLRITDPSRLERDQPLLDLGFDSLMAVELRDVLRRSLGLEQKLPATLVFDHPTITAIASFLETLLQTGPSRTAAVAEPIEGPVTAPRLDAAEVAALDDDEVEALLLARLTEIES